jgi:hypothetical protein
VVADVALSVVPTERSGMASGINDTFRQVGIAVGVAVWGAIFLGRASGKVSALVAGTPAGAGDRPRQLVEALSGGRLGAAVRALPHGTREAAVAATHQGFLTGMNSILEIGAGVAFAGAVLALWLVREHEIERERPEAAGSRQDTLEPVAA